MHNRAQPNNKKQWENKIQGVIRMTTKLVNQDDYQRVNIDEDFLDHIKTDIGGKLLVISDIFSLDEFMYLFNYQSLDDWYRWDIESMMVLQHQTSFYIGAMLREKRHRLWAEEQRVNRG